MKKEKLYYLLREYDKANSYLDILRKRGDGESKEYEDTLTQMRKTGKEIAEMLDNKIVRYGTRYVVPIYEPDGEHFIHFYEGYE